MATQDKRRYAYILTPKGLSEKAALTSRFLKRKMEEYEALKEEIDARVLVLGLTFKENCPDLRNTRIVDVVRELQDYGIQVDVHDPWTNVDEERHEYGLDLMQIPKDSGYDGIVLAVAHDQFKAMGSSVMRGFGKADHVLYDLKNVLVTQESDLRL